MPNSAHKGFTLVELLVTISIISILSVIGITIFSSAQNSARTSATKATLDSIYKQIEQKRILEQKTLIQVTGSGCTCCICNSCGQPPYSQSCIDSLTNTFVTRLGMSSIPKDGWGDYIMMDENEREFGTNDCRTDNFWSIHGQGLGMSLPFMFCSN